LTIFREKKNTRFTPDLQLKNKCSSTAQILFYSTRKLNIAKEEQQAEEGKEKSIPFFFIVVVVVVVFLRLSLLFVRKSNI